MQHVCVHGRRSVVRYRPRWLRSGSVSLDYQTVWDFTLRQGVQNTQTATKENLFHKYGNVTGRHRGPKRKLRTRYRAPSLKWTTHVVMRFHRRVCYRALSLAMHVFEVRASSSPQATFLPNFVSFEASVAELAHGEKLLTHSLTLFVAPATEAFASEHVHKTIRKRKFEPSCCFL